MTRAHTRSDGTLISMLVFQPSIVVTTPDSPEILLVVGIEHLEHATDDTALKSYMIHMSCPVGILVTPQMVRIYRNRYTGYVPQSVEMIGECQTSELLGESPQGLFAEAAWASRIQEWLESLAAGSYRLWPSGVQEAIESSVAPLVAGGVVRAGGPRWRPAG